MTACPAQINNFFNFFSLGLATVATKQAGPFQDSKKNVQRVSGVRSGTINRLWNKSIGIKNIMEGLLVRGSEVRAGCG